jgi:hypothetical protein
MIGTLETGCWIAYTTAYPPYNIGDRLVLAQVIKPNDKRAYVKKSFAKGFVEHDAIAFASMDKKLVEKAIANNARYLDACRTETRKAEEKRNRQIRNLCENLRRVDLAEKTQ